MFISYVYYTYIIIILYLYYVYIICILYLYYKTCLMFQQVEQLKNILTKNVPGGKGAPPGAPTDDAGCSAPLAGSSSRSLASSKNQETQELRRMLENLKQKAQSRSLHIETNALTSLAKLMQLKADFLNMNTPQSNLAAARCQQNIDVLLMADHPSPSSLSLGEASDYTPRSLSSTFASP
jgi:hypothetical protein